MAIVYTRGGVAAAIGATSFVGVLFGLAMGRGAFDAFREWQTLIAAFVALGAAAVAYQNTTRQIAASRALAAAVANETFEAIRTDLRDVLELLNELWRTLDHALTRAEAVEPRQRAILVLDRASVVITVAGSVTNLPLEILRAMAVDLSPLKRRNATRIIDMLAITSESIGALIREENRDRLPNRMNLVRIHLSHLHRYLIPFDPTLANIFHGRQMRNVDHRNAAAHIRPFVDQEVGD